MEHQQHIDAEDAVSEETKKKIDDNQFFFKRTKFIFDFALETWYPQLRDFTARTEFVHLGEQEMRIMHDACLHRTLSEDGKALIEKFVSDIDSIIQTKFNGSAFVKLSTRSPKDALTSVENTRFKQALMDELKHSDGSANEDTCAFVQACRNSLRVQSGREAIELLLMSSRIREDLQRALEFPNAFKLDIIIREWHPMQASMEFRGFVYNHNLNAVSQYCYMQYFKDLPPRKASIEQQIKEFHSTFKDLVPQQNYIVDFAITHDGSIQIVELNPFFQDTSACLFDWKVEEDRKTIQNGPFEFRILEQPVADPYGCLSPDWRVFFEELRGLPSKSKHRREKTNSNSNKKSKDSQSDNGCVLM
eukprot:TRINITY_DN4369_c0_g1_i1.p1 TRINITY_DN4369_c0_g1~~TRINITY_DN4369_c0_g1_i1.p1  ORF type:complete len:361 (-),score=86.40 TRINITY_DN4369_c0_g1_i1:25-1107(-)